mmetsp:Transcript_5387/g.3102  ORF Transcript_5387/g.3102 Transcript_5387/m.3102 type:complete len:156 (-) Transcript_5387:1432-1899(-)
MEKGHIMIVARNKKAMHNYFIEDKLEAGIVLTGTEVKAMRMGKANLKNSYAKIENQEVYVYEMHIGVYPFAYYENHAPLRPRKLLLHKYEIKKLYGKVNERGTTLIPLKVYFKNGKVKILLGIATGKKKYDKREAIRQRDEQRDIDRAHKNGWLR